MSAPTITPELAAECGLMLAELESSRLEVVLVPQRWHTNEGGMVRCAISRNATWYRDFCAAHSSARVRKNAAHDTRIKRAGTVRVLGALAAGALPASGYAPVLLAIARRRLMRPAAAVYGRQAMTQRLFAVGGVR